MDSGQQEQLLVQDWLQSPEGAEILRAISVKDKRPIPYGLLERPLLPATSLLEDVHYKLIVVGKGAVGKTSTIAHLSGRSIPDVHSETSGIQTTKIYWPVKIAHLNKKVLMNLTFWDTGEVSGKKFDHIFPACKAGLDGILYLFSFIDKGSWEELPHLIARLTEPGERLATTVIGTKFDQYSHSEVNPRELRDFESRWQTTILKISNVPTCDDSIQTTKIYWPVKIAHLNKKVLMNLTFWDTGEVSGKKFDHIFPACKAGLDGILYLFSFIDKGSWEELPHLIARLTEPGERLATTVIGTKFDQYSHSEVNPRELRDFESRWQTTILKISNVPTCDDSNGMAAIIPILNCICNHLLQRDVLKEDRK